MNTGKRSDVLRELGIPETYGLDPKLPRYAEARRLVDVEPNIVGHVQRLSGATAVAWRDMKTEAAAHGVSLLLVSGFRSIERQAELIRRKLAAGQSLEAILRVNTAPGFSEHHTGRAIDIATPGCPPLVEAFESTAAFEWLGTHAGRFGFSMPYGRDNALGICYEPWHWSTL
jgi:D-alanyl-D-alanine carboxypeptidase